jgi:hypothetical protein
MEERIRELEKKVAALEAQIASLLMAGAGNANEGLAALRADLLKRIGDVEQRVRNMP